MKITAILLLSFLTNVGLAYGQIQGLQNGCDLGEVTRLVQGSTIVSLSANCPEGLAQKIFQGNKFCLKPEVAYAIDSACPNSSSSATNPDKESCDSNLKAFQEEQKNYTRDHRDAVGDLRDDKKKLTEEIEELTEETAQHQAKMNDLRMEYQNTLEQLEAKRQEKLEKLEEEANKMSQDMTDEYNNMNSTISELLTSKEEVELKITASYKEAEGQCVQQAQANLAVYLKDRSERLLASRLSERSSHALFRKSGSSVEKENSSLAYAEYLKCIRGKPHRDRLELIEKQRLQALNKITNAISSIRAKQGELILKMGGEKRRKAFEKQLSAIEREYQLAARQAQSTLQAKYQDEENQYKMKIAKGMARGKRLKAVEEAVKNSRKLAGTSDDEDEDDIDINFVGRFPSIETILKGAENVISACKCNSGAPLSSTACIEAKNFRCAGDIHGAFETAMWDSATSQGICTRDDLENLKNREAFRGISSK